MSGVRLYFQHMPSPLMGFLRATVSGGRGVGEGCSIPRLEAEIAGVHPEVGHIRRYAELCGYPQTRWLPLTYPHVLAAPLHLSVLTHRVFPLRLLGLVHVRNAVHQLRPLERGERLHIQVRVEGHREAPKGVEFDLETRASEVRGKTVWYSTSTYLAPSRQKTESGGWTPPPLDDYVDRETWDLPANLGRRYGWLAGDINPIHLSPLSAKLFGFRRQIAHGMWTFARCAAALTGGRNSYHQVSMEVTFRRPIFLPGRARLLTERDGDHYAVVDPAGEEFHVTGRVEAG